MLAAYSFLKNVQAVKQIYTVAVLHYLWKC
ncbi:MAG: hypothetical protein RL172_2877 [Bacteroidota bacterium]|jgi:hypothetical protein